MLEGYLNQIMPSLRVGDEVRINESDYAEVIEILYSAGGIGVIVNNIEGTPIVPHYAEIYEDEGNWLEVIG